MSDGSFCHYCRRAECICPDSLAAQATREAAKEKSIDPALFIANTAAQCHDYGYDRARTHAAVLESAQAMMELAVKEAEFRGADYLLESIEITDKGR